MSFSLNINPRDSNGNQGSRSIDPRAQVRAYDDPPNFTRRSNVGIDSKLFSKNPSKLNNTENQEESKEEEKSHSSKDSDDEAEIPANSVHPSLDKISDPIKNSDNEAEILANPVHLSEEKKSYSIKNSDCENEEPNKKLDQNYPESKSETNSLHPSQSDSDKPPFNNPVPINSQGSVEITMPNPVSVDVIPEVEDDEQSSKILLKNEINLFSLEVYKLYQENYMNLSIPFESERFETAFHHLLDININKLD